MQAFSSNRKPAQQISLHHELKSKDSKIKIYTKRGGVRGRKIIRFRSRFWNKIFIKPSWPCIHILSSEIVNKYDLVSQNSVDHPQKDFNLKRWTFVEKNVSNETEHESNFPNVIKEQVNYFLSILNRQDI